MTTWTWHSLLDGHVFAGDRPAGEACGHSPRTIEGWRARGELAYVRVGRRVVIHGADLADCLDRRSQRIEADATIQARIAERG